LRLLNKKLRIYESPAIDQIPAEIIRTGGNTLRSENHKFINCIWNKGELLEQLDESTGLPFYKMGDKTDL
jgi:hypothetical protein